MYIKIAQNPGVRIALRGANKRMVHGPKQAQLKSYSRPGGAQVKARQRLVKMA